MANLLLKRIKDWATSITSFRGGDVIPVDGPSGTAKMSKDDLLARTAENALVDNLSPKFDPTKPNDAGGYAYYAGTSVFYEGKNYVFAVNHRSGPWNFSEVEQKPLSSVVDFGSVGEAVNAWLDDHPEATTTVQDGSLTEAKFSNILKLQTIKDYVTPEMFGAVGDGVTDDTNAFTAMVAASNKYLLIKNYVVSGIVINKTFAMVGTPGNSIKALGNEQEFILRLDSGDKNCIVGVNFNGRGSSSPDARGNVVGVLLNAGSTSEFFMERCTFTYCKTGLFAPKTFWHSKVSLCRFNGCGTGISIGYTTSSANQTYLELLFSQVYCNQCDLHIYLEFGSDITFSSCSFGSEGVLEGSRFFQNRYPCYNVVFRSCNFEGVFVKTDLGALDILSTFIGTFEDCFFHAVNPVQDVSSSNASLFRCRLSEGNKIVFTRCRFASMSVDYVLNCPTGISQYYVMDYATMQSISSAFSRKFDGKNVFGSSLHRFNISDIPVLSEVPATTPWNSGLNAFFRGVVIHINKTSDFYMWNGGSWVKLVYVPQPASDENTYTLKNVAGTLTWVQDT